jgi:hypothetical protein
VSGHNLDNLDPRSLAQLIDLDASPKPLWDSHELGSILRHQLTAPLQLQLSQDQAPPAISPRAHSDPAASLSQSLRDLLADAHAPVGLLVTIKDFAKKHAAHIGSPLPQEVSRVIYLLAIAAAMVHCHRRITRQDDAELAKGLEWAGLQEWVEQGERDLLQAALIELDTDG